MPHSASAAQNISIAGLFEFTPHGQSDLDHWSDMVSVLVYRNATDADGLLNVAKTVLAHHQAAQRCCLKHTFDAEHTSKTGGILYLRCPGQPQFAGVSISALCTHSGGRLWDALLAPHLWAEGWRSDERMGKENGPSKEKLLMSYDPVPTIDLLNQWKAAGAVKD